MLIPCYFLFSVLKLIFSRLILVFLSDPSIHPSSVNYHLLVMRVVGGLPESFPAVTEGGKTWIGFTTRANLEDPISLCMVFGLWKEARGHNENLRNHQSSKAKQDASFCMAMLPFYCFLEQQQRNHNVNDCVYRDEHFNGWKTFEDTLTEAILKRPLLLQPQAES